MLSTESVKAHDDLSVATEQTGASSKKLDITKLSAMTPPANFRKYHDIGPPFRDVASGERLPEEK
jgi:hypothetical protein